MLQGLFSKCRVCNISKTPICLSLRGLTEGGDFRVSDVEPLPKDARVVICGGGVIGASVAYHLAELGWGKDTILLEQAT
jgi:NADPH-dependent 2,4-dienoyl-CoA reductase/sulfur reductase-like enzyme